MATQDYAASVQGVAIRVTRLDASGNLLTEPGDSYTTSAFLRASFTPEYEEGEDDAEVDGDLADGASSSSEEEEQREKERRLSASQCK